MPKESDQLQEALKLVGIELLTPGSLEWEIVYNGTKRYLKTKGLQWIRENQETLQGEVEFMA